MNVRCKNSSVGPHRIKGDQGVIAPFLLWPAFPTFAFNNSRRVSKILSAPIKALQQNTLTVLQLRP